MATDEREKDAYSWKDFTKDLALLTRLKLNEASVIALDLQTKTDLHPYDVLEPMRALLRAEDEGERVIWSSVLMRLMNLRAEA